MGVLDALAALGGLAEMGEEDGARPLLRLADGVGPGRVLQRRLGPPGIMGGLASGKARQAPAVEVAGDGARLHFSFGAEGAERLQPFGEVLGVFGVDREHPAHGWLRSSWR